MIDRNADTPEDKRIRFRIGVNLGDVIVEQNDLFGDVNLAARLEALAEPGGICISRMVRDEIRTEAGPRPKLQQVTVIAGEDTRRGVYVGAPTKISFNVSTSEAYPRWGSRFGADSHPGSNAA